jgi:hypothetical protein
MIDRTFYWAIVMCSLALTEWFAGKRPSAIAFMMAAFFFTEAFATKQKGGR